MSEFEKLKREIHSKSYAIKFGEPNHVSMKVVCDIIDKAKREFKALESKSSNIARNDPDGRQFASRFVSVSINEMLKWFMKWFGE